jgi:hypothetical protein
MGEPKEYPKQKLFRRMVVMRKVIGLLLAAWLIFVFSAPVSAADKTVEERIKSLEDTIGAWSIYGSARFATFYEKDSGADPGGVYEDSKYTIWDLQSNSRIGLTGKRGDLKGNVELGLNSNNSIVVRHAYGRYQLGDVNILIGKSETIFANFSYSNQCGVAYFWDTNLQDWGFIDEAQTPMVQFTYKGLIVDFVKTTPKVVLPSGSYATYEALTPHLEAQYHLDIDRFYADVFGGAGTFKVKALDGVNVDKTVNSYAVGLGGGVTLDPVYFSAAAWTGRNGSQMGIFQVTSMDYYSAAKHGAKIAADGSITNDKNLGFAAVAGLNIQKVTVEGGYGYTSSEYDESSAEKYKGQSYYLQAVIPIKETPGAKFFVVPEVGVFDLSEVGGVKNGKTVYGGAKWQVNF